jgi:16S rRNA (guanine966-N2)-methyltransferase
MRIIAGQWRGRRLKAPSGDRVRPTTDRTKEALFNILGSRVAGSVVLDLCCGAGSLGLEALSRGAAQAIFVDRASAALSLVRANLELCGASAATYRLESGDAIAWLRRWPGSQGVPWVLLCDPPYQSGTAAAMMAFLTTAALPAALVCAVVEYGERTPDLPLPDPAWETRRYGGSHLAIHRPGVSAP